MVASTYIGTSGWHYDHWAGTFLAWLEEGLDVYCYFDNDEAGYATQDALGLQRFLQDRGVDPAPER